MAVHRVETSVVEMRSVSARFLGNSKRHVSRPRSPNEIESQFTADNADDRYAGCRKEKAEE
ncbi:hypothetical protein N7454_009335 [Penicillium verhagenii]|nr:hypothetical protein N7454_009335 [Penicillium verhagenii]